MEGNELFFKLVGFIVDKLVYVVNGNVKGSVRFVSEVVFFVDAFRVLRRFLEVAVVGV